MIKPTNNSNASTWKVLSAMCSNKANAIEIRSTPCGAKPGQMAFYWFIKNKLILIELKN